MPTSTTTRSRLKIGALFAGYGGLDLAVEEVFDAELEWVAEFEEAPSRILAHHYPNVPNLGDVTKIDWASVPYVDILTGGSPCQDLSHAGKRRGMRAGTRSGLWAAMTDAIDIIRPRLVVWENVRGAYSAQADSDLEFCPGCMGGPGDGRPLLRALGRVLGDLADIGYDARWYGLRVADVGGAHGRFRVFLIAAPSADAGRLPGEVPAPGRLATVEEPSGTSGEGSPRGALVDLFRTPTSSLGVNGGSQHPEKRKAGGHGPTLADEVEHLLGTPRTADGIMADLRDGVGDPRARLEDQISKLLPTPLSSDNPDARRRREDGSTYQGDGYERDTLLDAVLLPTPRATDGTKGGPNQRGSSGDPMLPAVAYSLQEEKCPTCGDPVALHDADGFCAGPCGGNGFGCYGREVYPDPAPLLPTPMTSDRYSAAGLDRGRGQRRDVQEILEEAPLLPTPTSSDYKGSTTKRRQPGQHRGQLDALTEGLLSMPVDEADDLGDDDDGRLLPTPVVSDSIGARNSTAYRDPDRQGGHAGDTLTDVVWKHEGISDPKSAPVEKVDLWRQYGDAVRRAERAVGRPAPPPTETTRRGGQALSPRFVEWLMMLPEGWVTDPAIGLSRNAQLKALGNGVVPAQAAAALRAYLADEGHLDNSPADERD